ncbi:MAG: chemotaxis protein CheW [Helicobacteraceae bacterium]
MDKLRQVLQNQKSQKDTPKEKAETGIVQLVCFMVGDEEFGVPILSIQEIIKPIESTRVPSTPSYVLGVFNLRGSVIPLIDLRQKFKHSKKNITEDTRFIVIKNKNQVSGFVIDKLTESIRISEDKIDPAPESMNDDNNHIYGVGKRDDRIISILRIESLFKKSF